MKSVVVIAMVGLLLTQQQILHFPFDLAQGRERKSNGAQGDNNL